MYYLYAGGPIVKQEIMFTLQTPHYQQPSIYNLSIITTASPASYISWKYYNNEIDNTILSNSYQQQREVTDPLACTTKTTLTITGSVSGLFSVSVANSRTKAGFVGGVMAEKGESAIFVKGKLLEKAPPTSKYSFLGQPLCLLLQLTF